MFQNNCNKIFSLQSVNLKKVPTYLEISIDNLAACKMALGM